MEEPSHYNLQEAFHDTTKLQDQTRQNITQLQQQLNNITTNQFLNAGIDTNDETEYLDYLQYLALSHSETLSDISEFTNPFATEGGGIEEMAIAGVEHDNTWLLDYPQLQKMAEQVYSQETISQYRVLANATMNPVGYPPNHPKAKPGSNISPPLEPGRRGGRFKYKDSTEWWNLPTAHQQTGALLTLST